MAEIQWNLAQSDPIAQQKQAYSYADMIGQNAAKYQAGQQYSAGDYAGAAKTQAQAGNIDQAQAISQEGQKSTEAVHAYITQALPVFQKILQVHAGDPDGGSGAIGQAFDSLAPEISQLTGHNDQALGTLRQALVSDPQGTLARIQAMVPVKYSNVAPGSTVLRQQGNETPEPVFSQPQNAPAGYRNNPDGSQAFIPGGPGDPDVIKRNATERRTVIVNNPIPSGAAAGAAEAHLGNADPTAPNITGQTGLSMDGFNYLIGNMAAMGRDKETRARASKEAGQFAARSGTDVATIKSQYTALNNVLQNNLQRANQMEILENEVQGTVQNLGPVADKISPSNLKWTREGIQFVGGLQNDPNVQQYATYLNQLRADLAGFNAVSGGKMTENGNARTDESDFRSAEKIISNGLSSGGARGLATAIQATGQKNRAIVEDAIDGATQKVWGLFGVGNNYKPKHGGGTDKAALKAKYGLD